MSWQRFRNIYHLAVKEFYSLLRDPIMLLLIVHAFSLAIYRGATAMPQTLHQAPISVVDEDRSQLSLHIIDGFYPPHFMRPVLITAAELDSRMDAGLGTFALHIPAGFQRDVLAGRTPSVELSVDATRMSQAFTGGAYIEVIVQEQVNGFVSRDRGVSAPSVELALRARFNPELNPSWFGGVMEIINSITMLSIVLTGAALMREREHGTLEHLLVMPVTPFEIMVAKVLSMSTVVLIASTFALNVVVRGLMGVPVEGALLLFFFGAGLQLFATTSLAIFLATMTHSMQQFGMLLLLVLLPLEMLSGGSAPRENMPQIVQCVMLVAPNTHFVKLSQGILYRGAGLEVVWPQLISLGVIGVGFFVLSWARFRKTLASMV